MTLQDLKGILEMSVDFADDEIDNTVFFDIGEIPDKYLRQIEVLKIRKGVVICRFTEFLRHHKTALRKFIKTTVNYDYEDFFINSLCESKGDITDDGGEAVYQFIEYYLYDFLTDFLAK